jgi:hypothetical protein
MIVVVTGLWQKNKSHMKKLLSILCVSIIALTAASCKKDTIVTPNNNRTYIQQIASEDWDSYNATTLSADLSIPAIDNVSNENDAVLVYIAYGKDAPWEQIPETFDGQAFSFTHNPGHVTLYTQNSTGGGAPTRPDDIYVKVVVVESNIN